MIGMVSERGGDLTCPFCGSHRLQRTHHGLHHPLRPAHGPFEFHRCRRCGSGVTVDPPDEAALTALYASFRDGLPDLHREITADDPQNALYSLCIRRAIGAARQSGRPVRTWIDVGAGGGELSRLLAAELPSARGLAVDLHTRPAALQTEPAVDWRVVDVNGPEFHVTVGRTADLVISTSVWEHVVRPDLFALNLVRMVAPGGMLYLLAPDYGSLARRAMGRHWPYFTPGEHLNMPTCTGAVMNLRHAWGAAGLGGVPDVRCVSLWLPYTLRYVARRLGFHAVGRWLPAGLTAPVPAGALEAMLLAPRAL